MTSATAAKATETPRDAMRRFASIGVYYDCGDSPEELSCDSPDEALEQYIDTFLYRDKDATKVIDSLCPITLTAYKRDPLDERWASHRASLLVERAQEDWLEEYGGPNQQNDLPKDAMEVAEKEMLAVVRKLFSAGSVWNCSPCGTLELDAEQVEALMREARPDWWEE